MAPAAPAERFTPRPWAGTLSGERIALDAGLIVLDGTTFFLSDAAGNALGSTCHGYYYADVRHLSEFVLTVGGDRLAPITSAAVDHYSARIELAPRTARPSFAVRRDRFVAEALRETIVVSNLEDTARSLRIEVHFAADFADVMEVRAGAPSRCALSGVDRVGPRSVLLWCAEGRFRRATAIEVGGGGEIEDDRVSFDVHLEPHGRWETWIDVAAVTPEHEAAELERSLGFRTPEPVMGISVEDWLRRAPQVRTPNDALRRTYAQSIRDLAALRIRPRGELSHAMPAGGIPWYMCVFGRDALIAAYQALPFEPTLAEATLRTLAALQARELDDWRDAEPGKLPHELRRGKLVALGRSPRDPYYGTHDATPLWLLLLDEYEKWTGDDGLVRELEPVARSALAWIDEYADRDGDGYAEYESRSSNGLRNHCWKDSDDSIVFGDGRTAEPPIATCEVQGYIYAARLASARMARAFWSDRSLGDRLEAEATALADRFNRDFWNPETGTFHLALAGSHLEHKVDAVSSNPGHLLWTGIVAPELAGRVVEALVAPAMFSGWGIRTLSSEEPVFNPLSYHRGSVWPHDTVIAAAGMRRYGFHADAARVIEGLLQAATAFGHRLPELFGGFDRDAAGIPTRYPDALVPQAWAAGAVPHAIRVLLGLAPLGDRLDADPVDADIGRELRLVGVPYRGSTLDVP